MLITRALPEELPALQHIEAQQMPHPWSTAQWSAELAQPDSQIWCLRPAPGQAIAAFAVCRKIIDELHIFNIAVGITHQRQGLARTLLRHVRDWAMSNGCQALQLEVRAQNHPARALYQAAGFTPVGQRKNYYPAPHADDAVMMVCKLVF